jgi:serine/threonine-protein kinase HipA
MSKPLKLTEALVVSANGRRVGELYRAEAKGIYFTYDPEWLAKGFNLSPFSMSFDDKPQLARDNLFRGLHGPFADSLPDGWGLRLMDRFFNSHFGPGTSLKLTQLDRLAYLGDRGMGAFDYQPKAEQVESEQTLSLARLFEASNEVQAGETEHVLKALRIAGGSPGGARPKAVVALSADGSHAASAFAPLASGYEHHIVKFRALDEPWETGAIEQAYAVMARQAGVVMAESMLLDVAMPEGRSERFFASKRFDRRENTKLHMMTVSALVHADFRTPALDYSELLKLTNALTRSAVEVEKMARLMIFNALSHNYDDHTKNFAFLYREPEGEGDNGCWTLAPAYDLTFSQGMGEHTTAFSGRGKPTRKLIKALCKDYKYLKPDDYIEQTLEALANWETVFADLTINASAGKSMFNVLSDVRSEFLGEGR